MGWWELGPEYRYTFAGKIANKSLEESGIFHEFTKVKCEDLIEGDLDNHLFKMVKTNLCFKSEKWKTLRAEEHNSF